ARDLAVGWPFVWGAFADGTPVRAPLLRFAVDLVQERQRWCLRPRGEAPVAFNRALLLAWAHHHRLPPDEALLHEDFAEAPTDLLSFRTYLYERLKHSAVHLNFRRETFEDRLVPFESFRRADYEARHTPGKLYLMSEAVLGLLPRADSFLGPDYDRLLALDPPPGVGELFGAADPAGAPPREDQTYAPFALNAAQEEALRAAKRGQSLVVQGPPGTGKSQLICNVVADFAARGKRVLVVCQKKAALDVVYERLQEVGMADFTALVHDFEGDRRALYDQLSRQIGRLDDYRRENNRLDALQLERRFTAAARRVEQHAATLAAFRHALFEVDTCGLSAKELYLTSSPHAPALPLDDHYRTFDFRRVPSFLDRLRRYFDYAPRFDTPEYPWRDRRDFAAFSFQDLRRLQDAPPAVADARREFDELAGHLTAVPLTLPCILELVAQKQDIYELLMLLNSRTVHRFFAYLQDAPPVPSDHLRHLREDLAHCFGAQDPWETGTAGAAEALLKQVGHALTQAETSRTAWWQWKWFHPDRAAVRAALTQAQLALTPDGLRWLTERLERRLRLERLVAQVQAHEGLPPLAHTLDRETLEKYFADLGKARRAQKQMQQLKGYAELWPDDLAYDQRYERSVTVLRRCEYVQALHTQWSSLLTPGQIEALWTGEVAAGALVSVLTRDFEDLVAFDRIRSELDPAEAAVLSDLHRALTEASETDNWFLRARALFDNSLRLAWLAHLERETPALRAVSSREMSRWEAELQAAVAEKEALSRDILLLRLREHTYQGATYNRLRNRVTYRDLLHQVTKKRQRWPVRRLIGTFADELFRLTPCWLASPESVSALFPMTTEGGGPETEGAGVPPGGVGKWFDVVVFDEASQCFAERGIPALARARQALVLGDDQQLRPHDLYRARWDDADDDAPETEVESLLELASYHLPRVQLIDHYRSRSLDLIDFSNRHFYDGSLRLLPDYGEINRNEPGIHYERVPGLWEQQTNRPEAEAVVSRLAALVRAGERSIGVVTFNARQQVLIQDLLDATPPPTGGAWPESLFVKNIENVQGDERDVIVFSVAYGPDREGKIRAQFGSLGQEGGENRLNVAVTRARRRVYVVCSVRPDELKVQKSRRAGPKLLRAYLQYAHDVSQRRYRPSPRFADGADGALSAHLRDEHAALVPELPFADLTVKTYHRYRGLLLLDDEHYRQYLSAKEAHAYLPVALRAKQWPHLRLWSRVWWSDPDRARAQVRAFIEQCLKQTT
ncbi:MAG: AAA domain-containing protein, partial [Catalinimonas sp.]